MARLRYTVAPFNHVCLAIMAKDDVAFQAAALPVRKLAAILRRLLGVLVGHASFLGHVAIPRTQFGRFVTRNHAIRDQYHRKKKHFVLNFMQSPSTYYCV